MSIDAINAVNFIEPGSQLELGKFSSPVGQNDFFSLIGEKLQNIDDSIKKSDGLIEAYIKGENIPVHEIMVSLGKAKTEIQLAVEIRNKLLESYQEITRIQL